MATQQIEEIGTARPPQEEAPAAGAPDVVAGMRSSPQTEEIAPAFVKALGALQNVPTTKTANVKSKRTGAQFSYEYAPLSAVLDTIRPVFAEHGLAVFQPVEVGQERSSVIVRTRVIHESGQWFESPGIELPTSPDPQVAGSSMTYAKRYDLAAFCGIATDSDDDGASASDSARQASSGRRAQTGGGPRQTGVGSNGRPEVQAPASANTEQLNDSQLEHVKARMADLEGKSEKTNRDLQMLTWCRLLALNGGDVQAARDDLKTVTDDRWESVEEIPTEVRDGKQCSALQYVYGQVKRLYLEDSSNGASAEGSDGDAEKADVMEPSDIDREQADSMPHATARDAFYQAYLGTHDGADEEDALCALKAATGIDNGSKLTSAHYLMGARVAENI